MEFLVLKMGSTIPSLKSRRGDFEDWIIHGADLRPAEARVIDVQAGEPLPRPQSGFAAIVSGSHSMVTERTLWSELGAEWLRNAVAGGVPVLGICYGHQLLAYAHGGRIANNPRGREFGTVQVTLDGAAAADELLGGLPARIPAHEGHTQSVLSLPRGAVGLAANAWDPHQAFRLGDRAWGVQFHPEFDADIVREYIGYYSETLSSEGQDPRALSAAARDDPSGPAILRRFVELCRSRD